MRWLVSAIRYLMAAVVCAVFAAIYESLSHGVYSTWMVLLFAYPLLLGAIPAVLGYAVAARSNRLGRQLWACGVMTLAMGSCLRGVLEIYGTTSKLIQPYPLVGAFLLVLAIVVRLADAMRKGRAGRRR